MDAAGLLGTGVMVGVAGSLAYYWVSEPLDAIRHARLERKARVRATRAEGAATEAAEEDPAFAPEFIRRVVGDAVAVAAATWHGDPAPSRARDDTELLRSWARTRTYWLGAHPRVDSGPHVDLLRVVNRPGEDEDRVDIRVRLRLRRNPDDKGYDRANPDRVWLDERWTLRRRPDGWIVVSAGGNPLALPVLSAPLIPDEAYDRERIEAASFEELAQPSMSPGTTAAELTGQSGKPMAALLDLSLVDGRFMPQLIEKTLSGIVEAWELASTGSESRLRRMADAHVVDSLLHPKTAHEGSRLVLQDASVKTWVAMGIDSDRVPVSVRVRVTVEAVRYLADEHTGVAVSGSTSSSHAMSLIWMLELTETPGSAWRLVSCGGLPDVLRSIL